MHDAKNDLIAGHYHSRGSPAALQFRNAKVTRDQRERSLRTRELDTTR
jgi:hypothetical protein